MRMQITPDDFKRAKLIKPGWYPFLIKEMTEELNSKKDATNIVLDTECADKESEFFGVPVKHWISEKGVAMPGGGVSFAKALNPGLDETKMVDFDFSVGKGKYIYAKIKQDRGKEGTDPPRNVIEDWAPLPKKFEALIAANGGQVDTSGVEGFAKV
jgi:hypothetical protein